MKILIVGSRMEVMKADVIYGIAPNRIISMSHAANVIELMNGTEITLVEVQKAHHVERLRGLRFDLFLEHSSFPRIMGLADHIKAYVLR